MVELVDCMLVQLYSNYVIYVYYFDIYSFQGSSWWVEYPGIEY